ncbi:MAG: MCP four helix bundle domain-containing protein, partial [Rhizobacter sp.]
MTWFTRAATWFAGIRIGARLTLSFTVVLLLTAMLGTASIVNLAKVNRTSTELADKWLPSVADVGLARAAVLEFRELEVKHTRAEDDSYRAEYEDKLKAATTVVVARMDDHAKRVFDPAEQKLADSFQARWKEYQAVNQKVLALGRSGKADDARDIGDGAAKMAADDVVAALDQLSSFNFEGGQLAAKNAATTYQQSRLWSLGLVAVALCLGVLMSVGLTRSLLAQLGGEPGVATAVARAVAAGDLSTPIVLRKGDSNSLMAVLQHMQTSLAQVVATVRQNSERVATASSEIAQGNSDLSGRTEQQASALQQTAASMEELGSTVRQNADNALQADRLAQNASAVASR